VEAPYLHPVGIKENDLQEQDFLLVCLVILDLKMAADLFPLFTCS
jgi:hypothetical protein